VPSIAPGHFAAAAAIPQRGGSDAAIGLTNGKVLVLGAGHPLLYDPALNQFSGAGAMVVERRDPLVAALPGGKVLVIGGDTFGGCALTNVDDVEIYDAAANTFSRVTSPIVGDVYDAATSLAGGTVLLTGGWTIDEAHPDGFRSSALFDPSTKAFTLLGGSLQPAPGAAVSALPDHTVLFAGGFVQSGSDYVATDAAVIYRPDHRDFVSASQSMRWARGNATATLLSDGRVLIAGGQRASDSDAAAYANAAELYDYRTGQFASTGIMAAKRSGHSATLLAGGSVLLAGAAGTSAEIWSDGTFHFTAGPMTKSRSGAIAVLLGSGRVLVIGNGSADLYQP
jgi:hypothetical protein